MLSSIYKNNFHATAEDIKRATDHLLAKSELPSDSTLEDLIGQIYDEVSTHEAKEIEFVLKHILTERPGDFPVVENKPIEMSKEDDNLKKDNQNFEHLGKFRTYYFRRINFKYLL